jgi:Glycosyltransferase family 87
VHRVADGLERGGHLRRDVVVDGEDVGLWHHHEGGEAAVDVHPEDAGVEADMEVPAQAGVAMPAHEVRFDGDPPAVLHVRASPAAHHLAAELVADDPRRMHSRRRPGVPVIEVHVGAADGRRGDAQQQLAVARYRFGNIGEHQPGRGDRLDHGLHSARIIPDTREHMIESAPGAQGRWLHGALRGAVGVAFALQAGLLVFVVVHNVLTAGAALDSDFSPGWLGASVWRMLGPGHGYDAAAQASLYAHVAAGQGHGWMYPNTWAPGALLTEIPLSFLSLTTAFDIWIAFQVVLLAAAAMIAATVAAPASSVSLRVVAASAAAVSAGAVATALFGQWDGIPALGVALAYALWSRGHEGRAALVLTVLLVSGKPHLALGLLAFAAARGSRRGLLGIAMGVVLTGVVDLALVQAMGMRGWIDTLGQISTLSATASLSVFGLLANTVGGSVAEGVAVVAAAALLAGAGAFGWLSSRGARLPICLLGATCVSLLVSPHLFSQDLALLIPVVAAMLALALARARYDRFVVTLAAFSALSLAAEYQVLPLGSLRADPFVPVVLLALVAWAWRATALRSPAGATGDAPVLRHT